jgi:fructose-bisphosphate aldolase class I
MKEILQTTIIQLLQPGKGILAADESIGTISKRFVANHIENTEEERQAYRELLFTTKTIERYISGVILFDETIRQTASDGQAFRTLLQNKGIILGIKVDLGTKPLPQSDDELVTRGLEGLVERLEDYFQLGARFAKWRAVFRISRHTPSERAIAKNAGLLANYAKLCQSVGIVPIVEPEVLMDGEHTSAQTYAATTHVLQQVFKALRKKQVQLDGMLLKPNMIVPGMDSSERTQPERVGVMTVACYRVAVPKEVPGIVLLSGGQSEAEACANLQAINELAGQMPWTITYSFGRALQDSALHAWKGLEVNTVKAQGVFLRRAILASSAQRGIYSVRLEK